MLIDADVPHDRRCDNAGLRVKAAVTLAPRLMPASMRVASKSQPPEGSFARRI